MTLRTVVSLAVCLALSACLFRPHRIDVQQGNFIDKEMISKLKPGMTRAQVRFILGTPLIADPFNPERWDYLFIDRKAGRLKQVRRLVVYFSEDRLVRALTDIDTEPDKAAPQQTAQQGR
jgi:outer membrane protein assembly factor BamE